MSAFSLALLPLLLVGASWPAWADIKIGIIGDQTGAADLDKSYAVLQQGVDALRRELPDVVLHAGDLIESLQTPEQIAARFAQASAILGRLGAPWYLTAGDHDVSPPNFVQDSPDRSREVLFRQLYGRLNPSVQKRLYYSFDVKDYHFIVLYSSEALDTDPRWGNVFYAGISDEQYDWLAKDLELHAGSRGIFVLLHQPLWYMWSTWDRVHRLLAGYPTRAVIAGHFHYHQADLRIDNIAYQVVGATGGDTKQGSANAGQLQHVTMLTARDDGSLDFRMIPLAPYTQIGWTSRTIMDRIQAQDVLLGNLFSFATDSPVFIKNGQLVANCDSAAPARLVLGHLGNADAVPVDVSLDITAPDMSVTGTFDPQLCAQMLGPLSCRMKASAGVAVSNNSVVQLAEFPPPPPLWTGVVKTSGAAPPPTTPIGVTVTMSFVADNQRFALSRAAATTVKACN
ncbi:metallophosphoesterase [Bradyrhizobium ontarionense]|uniref:Metallophosphoesterase n=1 Tax=Bradyrhizobium ontarionense TaxID=2898149 RepID=A0ABY3REU7_9BRAD|nr:metallophosphoesterase [Bradyrhizobium sp. A19]UFZ05960.1 metallophosphoesterase [Bradyrhizobium sp. A19]